MDSLRAVMMVLGVVLHAGQVFDPAAIWLMTNPEASDFYTHLTAFIHRFRMPVFFMVSGFFTLFVLLPKGPKYFALSKLERIGVPILTVALSLNMLQSVFLDHWNGRPFSIRDFLLAGWVGHLWFLINLLIYFMLIFLISPVFIKYHSSIKKALDTASGHIPALIILLLLPLTKIAILASNKVGFPLYWSFGEIISILDLVDYFIYFLFGIAMYLSPVLADKIHSMNLVVLAFLIAILYGVLGSSLLAGQDGLPFVILTWYVDVLQVWTMSLFVYLCFYKFFSGPSTFLRLISESSYTVYLVHHSLIIFLGAALVHVSLNVHIKFLLLFLVVYAISYVFHRYVVARSNLASYLLNGRTLKAPQ